MIHKVADKIAHAWAHGHDRPKGYDKHTVKYESGSDTIYSFGSHFPMARHYKGKVLLTLQTYSNTTASHMTAVRQAVSHMDVVYCYKIPSVYDSKDSQIHQDNIDYWIGKIKQAVLSLANARKKSIYLTIIETERSQARKYIDLFKLKLKKKYNTLLFEADLEEFKQAAEKEKVNAQNKISADRRKALALHDKWLPVWRKYNTHNFFGSGEEALLKWLHRSMSDGNAVWLRTNGTTVETTKGIELPVAVAHRYYKIYLSRVDSGGCSKEDQCGEKFLDFDVIEMTEDHLLVGCHDIPRSEIDYIAKQLKW